MFFDDLKVVLKQLYIRKGVRGIAQVLAKTSKERSEEWVLKKSEEVFEKKKSEEVVKRNIYIKKF